MIVKKYNVTLHIVGWLLTIIDLVFSFLGSMGSIGITNVTDIITSINKILSSILLVTVNIVLPVITVGLLKKSLKNTSPKNQNNSNSETSNNEKINQIYAVIINVGQIIFKILIYVIFLGLDCYTTFLGVGQSFILDELSNSIRVKTLSIDFATIIQNSSLEKLSFIISVSIILLTGHFILAGVFSEKE